MRKKIELSGKRIEGGCRAKKGRMAKVLLDFHDMGDGKSARERNILKRPIGRMKIITAKNKFKALRKNTGKIRAVDRRKARTAGGNIEIRPPCC